MSHVSDETLYKRMDFLWLLIVSTTLVAGDRYECIMSQYRLNTVDGTCVSVDDETRCVIDDVNYATMKCEKGNGCSALELKRHFFVGDCPIFKGNLCVCRNDSIPFVVPTLDYYVTRER